MNPPPITTTGAPCGAAMAAARRRRASAAVRSMSACSAPGSGAAEARRRWPAGNARRRRSRRRRRSPAAASGSMAATVAPVRSSTERRVVPGLRLGSEQLIGQVVAQQLLAERRAVVGARSSSPTSRIDPSNPWRRNVRAQRTEATPPPTSSTSTVTSDAHAMLAAPTRLAPMPLPDDLRLRTADAGDLPRIVELREAVGWGVHDWALRAVLGAARCALPGRRERGRDRRRRFGDQLRGAGIRRQHDRRRGASAPRHRFRHPRGGDRLPRAERGCEPPGAVRHAGRPSALRAARLRADRSEHDGPRAARDRPSLRRHRARRSPDPPALSRAGRRTTRPASAAIGARSSRRCSPTRSGRWSSAAATARSSDTDGFAPTASASARSSPIRPTSPRPLVGAAFDRDAVRGRG